MIRSTTALLASLILLAPGCARAEDCLLIVGYPSGATLHESGDCATRRAPASTFKLPLALMGFDSGLLTDEHTPRLHYKAEYQGYDFQQITTDPAVWLDKSIVWYSQVLTRRMGMDKFKAYVEQFDYGNRDVSGTPGHDDGLTQSWLFSSLEISPREQVRFLQRFLNRDLGVSSKAYDLTLAITPQFKTDSWIVHGKTGSGHLKTAKGEEIPHQPQGWFVGWAENGTEKVVFAALHMPAHAVKGPASFIVRDRFLRDLPELLAKR